jgi:glutamine synthetase
MKDSYDIIGEWLAERRIDEVEGVVPDQAGMARGKFMPARKFTRESGMRLPISVLMQTIAGEDVENEVSGLTDPDMNLWPDVSTIRPVPWAEDLTACVIHDCYYADGSPVHFAPRQVLKNVLALYEAEGWRPIVAPEVEFYLVKPNTDPDYPLEPPIGRSGRPETVRQPYSIDAVNEFDPLYEEIYSHCEAQEIEVDTLIHEMGAAQSEVNFQHGDALDLADQVFLFKRLVRETAFRHRVYATFMAKPMANEPGSAMHWHISVLDQKTGRNLFAHQDDSDSAQFRSFIAGLQAYHAQATLLCAPYVNSYRRFTRHMSAPINLQWGYDNRTVGLRVPRAEAKNRRVENRVAGADANPYLAIAASLACGYLGMKEGLKPADPLDTSAYNLPFTMPMDIFDAINRLRASDKLKSILGEAFVTVYSAIKLAEHDTYFQVISPWEREHLLLSV